MTYSLLVFLAGRPTSWISALPTGAAAFPVFSVWTWLLLGMLAGAGVALSTWMALGVRRKYASDNSRVLFRELCRAHELSRAERRLLNGLALHLRLKAPCLLFIDSNLWGIPDASDQDNLPGELNWGKLRKLQRVLFSPTFIQ